MTPRNRPQLKLGDIIRNQRKTMELSQSSVAKMAKVSQPMISKLEAGRSADVSFEIVMKLARVLKFSAEDVMLREDGNQQPPSEQLLDE